MTGSLSARVHLGPPPRSVPQRRVRDQDVQALFLLLFGGILGGVGTLVGGTFTLLGALAVLPVFLPIGLGIWLVMGGIGGLLARRGIRRLRAVRRVWEQGEVVTGQVLEAGWDRSVRVNRRSPVRVRYRYAVLGSPYEGVGHAWEDRLSQLPVGTEITLLVDPQEPQRSIWVSQTP